MPAWDQLVEPPVTRSLTPLTLAPTRRELHPQSGRATKPPPRRRRRSWLSERRTGVAAVRTSSGRLSLTAVIGAASDHAFANRARRDAVRRLWREMSADAHVVGWSLFQRSSFGLNPNQRRPLLRISKGHRLFDRAAKRARRKVE